MELWRISKHKDLDGRGGLFSSGRWHSIGKPIIYCGENPPGALIEVLVHTEMAEDEIPEKYKLFRIICDDSVSIASVDPDSLALNWRGDDSITRSVGDEWLKNKNDLLLRVPSAVMPASWNIMVNPLHLHISKCTIVDEYIADFEQRLFKF